MAPSFGRSISFPLTPGRASSKPRHSRSISLPARTTSSHPLLAELNTRIAAVRSLTHSSLTASLTQIHALHSALADLLLLQDPQDALHRATNVGDRLLDAFLLLADAHQGFQECLLVLKHAVAESSAALRRGDAARAASATRSQRRAEKELARLAVSVSSKCARLSLVGTEDAEMAVALMEAAAASSAASALVFSAASSMSSSSAASSCKKITSVFSSFGKKATAPETTTEQALERLHALEQCFDECDGLCDMVFRSIVQTRVSLLNIMTPTI
ncbi:uncharacterized protein [Lolium perenne]|uniref:uncharacterized protein n=1 Tax=Lolium perenne TaxID=4522 RepID=UPI0021EAA84C|nr:uncharacterized protein LOC127313211 [Lolium perenne]